MFEGTFELFDVKVRRLRNSDKLSLVLESAEDLETEKALIEFRGEMVEILVISNSNTAELKFGEQVLEGKFEVYDLKCRQLKNGNKLRLVLEELYDKAHEISAVKMRFDDIKLSMEKLPSPEFDLEEREI